MAKKIYPGAIQVLCWLWVWANGLLAKLTPQKKNEGMERNNGK
jgi:hypothetical protein